MSPFARIVCICCMLAVCAAPLAFGEDAPGVLLLSKSAGFQHQPIAEKDGQPSQVEIILRAMLEKKGMTLTATKDAGSINAENLESYSVVVFYTQGDLTEVGLDKQPAMGPDGVADLVRWIEGGGGFVGFHSATDTLRTNASDEATAYTNMIGAAFRGHGRQFVGNLRVVDPGHPTMAHIEQGFSIRDEWYVFAQMNTERIHVLALLAPGAERSRQKLYDVEVYPIVWCTILGEGRVYYNAMGHREDVWENETFLSAVGDAIDWAGGEGPANAEPNYASVMQSGTDD